jgi:hypothetical protein
MIRMEFFQILMRLFAIFTIEHIRVISADIIFLFVKKNFELSYRGTINIYPQNKYNRGTVG